MITLTRLDVTPVLVNEDQLVFAETTPGTVITMPSGQRLMVREHLAELIAKGVSFQRRVNSPATSAGDTSS